MKLIIQVESLKGSDPVGLLRDLEFALKVMGESFPNSFFDGKPFPIGPDNRSSITSTLVDPVRMPPIPAEVSPQGSLESVSLELVQARLAFHSKWGTYYHNLFNHLSDNPCYDICIYVPPQGSVLTFDPRYQKKEYALFLAFVSEAFTYHRQQRERYDSYLKAMAPPDAQNGLQ